MSKSKAPRQNRPTGGGSARPAPPRSAEQRSAEQRRKQAQRSVLDARRGGRHKNLYTILPVALVVVLVGALVLVYAMRGNSTNASRTAAGSAVVSGIAGVTPAAFDTVGVGSVRTDPTLVDGYQPMFASDGTLRVMYVGAEFCPYCAGERWSLAVALARFGDFANLQQIRSAPAPEVYPNTATLSFYGASFTSSYLSFTSYETADRAQNALESLSSGDQGLFAKYDASPYINGSAGSIPFLLVGGKYVFSGAAFDVNVLKGLSHDAIASALSNPSSPVAQAILGGANEVTAAICDVLTDHGSPPADVCGSSGVQAAADHLAKLVPVGSAASGASAG
ncbi:MAG: DUF929 domain-containing protein [Frankiaceae bacterium]|jgi:hypothetical protein|nr:DUF929 domain-containing protein [Frankiaceae bacterium]